MVLFTYCCADTADLVCQSCGAAESIPVWVGEPTPENPYGVENPLVLKAEDSGEFLGGELGFVGKEDCRGAFRNLFPDQVPPEHKA